MKALFLKRWFLIINCVSASQRNFYILDDVSTKILNKETIEKLSCQVFQIDNRSYVNCRMLLDREIGNVDVRTVLEFRKRNGPAMKLYDVRLDACLLMGSFHKNRFLNLYSKNVKKHSNLQCPLKANFNYTLKGLYMDEPVFPRLCPLDHSEV